MIQRLRNALEDALEDALKDALENALRKRPLEFTIDSSLSFFTSKLSATAPLSISSNLIELLKIYFVIYCKSKKRFKRK